MTWKSDHTLQELLHISKVMASLEAFLIDLELDHFIPDELHLMLRVMDVLIQALMFWHTTGTSIGCPTLTVVIRLLMGPTFITLTCRISEGQ